MQTSAEKRLILAITALLHGQEQRHLLLNVGAGKGVVVEETLRRAKIDFISDRVDIDDCAVDHPNVRYCYRCSAENMEQVGSETYRLAYSNYVLEHVPDLERAAREIARVLVTGGSYLATVPNPRAPEILVARRTPLWFHRWVTGGAGWPTAYSYRSIDELAEIFRAAGLELTEAEYYPFLRQYTRRFPVIRWLGSLYDRLARRLNSDTLKGNVFLSFKKK